MVTFLNVVSDKMDALEGETVNTNDLFKKLNNEKEKKREREWTEELHGGLGDCCLDLFFCFVFCFQKRRNIRMFEGRHKRTREMGRY